MAVPTRRRDSRSAQEARPPTTWEPARMSWNIEPLERLRTVSRMLDELTAD
jgi:hypothetical protein